MRSRRVRLRNATKTKPSISPSKEPARHGNHQRLHAKNGKSFGDALPVSIGARSTPTRRFWRQPRAENFPATIIASEARTGPRTPSEVNKSRTFFVDRATFNRFLEACPDHEWRLLLALARYGGLRTPSEPLTLEWADVNWERDRFRIIAPKTKHDDGGERWIPLVPEMRALLEEAFELAKPGAVHVITRYRDTNANLRTQLTGICRRAGIKTWPRLFQNLRASIQGNRVGGDVSHPSSCRMAREQPQDSPGPLHADNRGAFPVGNPGERKFRRSRGAKCGAASVRRGLHGFANFDGR